MPGGGRKNKEGKKLGEPGIVHDHRWRGRMLIRRQVKANARTRAISGNHAVGNEGASMGVATLGASTGCSLEELICAVGLPSGPNQATFASTAKRAASRHKNIPRTVNCQRTGECRWCIK